MAMINSGQSVQIAAISTGLGIKKKGGVDKNPAPFKIRFL